MFAGEDSLISLSSSFELLVPFSSKLDNLVVRPLVRIGVLVRQHSGSVAFISPGCSPFVLGEVVSFCFDESETSGSIAPMEDLLPLLDRLRVLCSWQSSPPWTELTSRLPE